MRYYFELKYTVLPFRFCTGRLLPKGANRRSRYLIWKAESWIGVAITYQETIS